MNQTLTKYPILKHFDDSQIITGEGQFKPGQKNIYNVTKLLTIAAVGAGGYFTWVYVLPTVFLALGQLLAVVLTIVGITALVVLFPTILKGLKHLSRHLQKALITIDPFEELRVQRKKLGEAKSLLSQSRSKIETLENEMMKKSFDFKSASEKIQTEILRLKDRADKTMLKIQEVINTDKEYKSNDHYIQHKVQLDRELNEANRKSMELTQSNDYIGKYGSRSVVMKKVRQKLFMAEAASDNKLADFDLTVKMLKHDYDFARDAKDGTNAAKRALMIDKTWELEFAMDTITNTIANDIAITTANISDISKLTADYDLNSDELYTRLDSVADNIRTGKFETTDPKKYKNEDYVMTHEEKVNSGFGSLF
jgi:hypothetical protein